MGIVMFRSEMRTRLVSEQTDGAGGALGPYAFSLACSITGGFHLVAWLIETAKRSIPLNIIAFGVGYRLF